MDNGKRQRIDANGWYAFDPKLSGERPGLDQSIKLKMQGDHWKKVSVTVAGYGNDFGTSPVVIRRILRDFRAEIKYPEGTERIKRKRGLIRPIIGDWSKHLGSRMLGYKDINVAPPPTPVEEGLTDEDIPF